VRYSALQAVVSTFGASTSVVIILVHAADAETYRRMLSAISDSEHGPNILAVTDPGESLFTVFNEVRIVLHSLTGEIWPISKSPSNDAKILAMLNLYLSIL
jgi:hypothetical protein